MAANRLNEADEWLNRAIDEVKSQLGPRAEGHFVVGAVLDRLRTYSTDFQRKVRAVLGRWLLSKDEEKIDWALMLVSMLEATEFILALKKLRWRVVFKLSPLPWDELSYINGILKSLQRKARGNN